MSAGDLKVTEKYQLVTDGRQLVVTITMKGGATDGCGGQQPSIKRDRPLTLVFTSLCLIRSRCVEMSTAAHAAHCSYAGACVSLVVTLHSNRGKCTMRPR